MAQGLWVKAQGNLAAQRLLETYKSMHKAVADYVGIVLPKVSEQYHRALTKVHLRFTSIWEPSIAYANDAFAYVSGKVGSMMVCVRANGDSAKQRVFSTYADMLASGDKLVRPMLGNLAERYDTLKGRATDSFQPYWVKIEGEFLLLQGKVGNTYVDIKAKLSDIFGDVTATLEPYYARIKGDCTDFLTKAGERVGPLKTHALNMSSEIRIYMDSAAMKAGERVG